MPSKTAVVVVHGVADQERGATAEQLAQLLVAQAPAGVRYEAVRQGDEVLLQVPALTPIPDELERSRPDGDVRARAARPDFPFDDWHRRYYNNDDRGRTSGLSIDVAFSNNLLRNAQHDRLAPETYQVPCWQMFRCEQQADGREQRVQVDVHEMYWADLSRLSGAAPRIVTELFTLLFRLSTLGRDTVHAATAFFMQHSAWRQLQTVQTWLDLAYSRGLALLFLQLLMLTLFVVPIALACRYEEALTKGLMFVVALISALAIYFQKRRGWLSMLAFAGLFSLAAVPVAIQVALILVVLLSWAYSVWMNYCEARFAGSKMIGWPLWLSVLSVLLLVVVCFKGRMAVEPTLWQAWVSAAMTAIEVVLVAIMGWWIVVGALLAPLWFWLGGRAIAQVRATKHREQCAEARTAVATGRFGLGVSLGAFLTLSMAAWAVLHYVIKLAVANFSYTPAIFAIPVLGPHNQAGCAADIGSATCFLEDRFVGGTSAFALIAVVLLVFLAYVIVTLLPSALAEAMPVASRHERLGRWLTAGYRWLDRLVAVLIGLASAIAMAVAAYFIVRLAYWAYLQVTVPFGVVLTWGVLPAALDSWLVWLSHVAGHLIESLIDYSQRLLAPLVITSGGIVVALSAVGGLISKLLPGLRAPLDVALDVDNHFREFPTTAAPRVRAFSRYVALLTHLRAVGYQKVVVVAHSQGAVLSTDLFRYLMQTCDRFAPRRAAGNADVDDVRDTWRWLTQRLVLVTAGSPLRQLYAARFPHLYEWVLRQDRNRLGPLASEVGVRKWINCYTTGDYIGRWLWSGLPNDADETSVPLIDEAVGRERALYTPNGDEQAMRAIRDADCRELDICIGAGAHVHYLNATRRWQTSAAGGLREPVVARVIDEAIKLRHVAI